MNNKKGIIGCAPNFNKGDDIIKFSCFDKQMIHRMVDKYN